MKHGRLITIGSFDGLHRGHQALLAFARVEARKRRLNSLALTFRVPPKMVLGHEHRGTLLSDPLEKEILLRSYGADEIRFLDFNERLAKMKPFLFFRDFLLRELRAKGLVIGMDFRFGLGRSAGALELVRWGQDFNVPVWVVPAVRWQKKVVSSTFLRQLLTQGYYRKAQGFLGHPYLIHGRAVRDQGLGRKIGFPTVNLATEESKLLPTGVYAVRGRLLPRRGGASSWFRAPIRTGVCNIGRRPTIARQSGVVVEVHFFKDPGETTGRDVVIELVQRLRGEKKFPSLGALTTAIRRDVRRARTLFSVYTPGSDSV